MFAAISQYFFQLKTLQKRKGWVKLRFRGCSLWIWKFELDIWILLLWGSMLDIWTMLNLMQCVILSRGIYDIRYAISSVSTFLAMMQSIIRIPYCLFACRWIDDVLMHDWFHYLSECTDDSCLIESNAMTIHSELSPSIWKWTYWRIVACKIGYLVSLNLCRHTSYANLGELFCSSRSLCVAEF